MNCTFSQTSSGYELNYSKSDIDLRGKVTRSPILLANALTKGKTSDKEKFDAIFAWVAANIKYNYRTYYSSNGVGRTNINHMLNYKSGICVDFAFLMDTLCSLSGIINTSIYGYAKDEIFDVHDSLYTDNHAWNAVKLDGDWFLYDVTWASGERDHKYTRFSKFLIRQAEKHPVKYKQGKLRNRKKYVFTDECGNEFNTPSYYYKQKFGNKIYRKILGMFRLKVVHYFTRKINPDYYLTDPEIFYITHHPDNPSWTLLGTKTVRNFESDSAFYHLDKNTYVNQNRGGRVCPDCNYDLSLDQLNKYHYLRAKSFNFNKRNSFISSYCEYGIAKIEFNKSSKETDSLPKVSLIDTSIIYLQYSRKSLKSCLRNVDIDFVLQKRKNKTKQMMLLEENRRNSDFIKSNIATTLTQKRSIRSMLTKSESNLRKFSNRESRIRNLKSKIFVDEKSKISEKVIDELNERAKNKELQIDSLNALIVIYKARYDSILTNLSLNVWQKVLYHDTLITPIVQSTYQRRLLKDNYKKPVVEIRKFIPEYQKQYSQTINDVVYKPSEIITDLASDLLKLINTRGNCEFDLYQAKLLLAKFNQMPLTELETFKSQLIEENKTDRCWLKGKIPGIRATDKGLSSLREKQVEAIHVIVRENEVERSRTHYVSTELLRRKKKYRHIAVNNSMVTSRLLSDVKKAKRVYLNMLKRERRKKKTK